MTYHFEDLTEARTNRTKEGLESLYRIDVENLNEARTKEARHMILDRISSIRKEIDALTNPILNYYKYLSM